MFFGLTSAQKNFLKYLEDEIAVLNLTKLPEIGICEFNVKAGNTVLGCLQINFYERENTGLYLNWINSSVKKQGYGSAALSWFLKRSDLYCFAVELDAQNLGLVEWYKKFGFEVTDGLAMRRKPQTEEMKREVFKRILSLNSDQDLTLV